jgi:hypothetical protein
MQRERLPPILPPYLVPAQLGPRHVIASIVPPMNALACIYIPLVKVRTCNGRLLVMVSTPSIHNGSPSIQVVARA